MAAAKSALRRDVVCPFCGLGCDDLVVAVDGGRISIVEGACALSRTGFEGTAPQSVPLIAGNTATLDAAVARAAGILRDSRQPLFAGLAADVAGVRAVMRLAERTGGIVDHVGGDGLFRNLRVVQDGGWMTTTLSEVRNHLDLLLIIGPDPTSQFPRFYERCVAPQQTMYEKARPTPEVLRIGPRSDSTTENPSGIAVTELPCALDQLPEAATALRCLVNGRPLHAKVAGGLPVATLTGVAEKLRASRYGIVTWIAGVFAFAGGDLLVQSLADLVRDLNQTTRCAALPLAGSDNAMGANQVCTWQSGLPLRSRLSRSGPLHDPLLYSTSRLVEQREIDVLVWISAFRPHLPPATALATIVIAAPSALPVPSAAVYIPVGTPGIDHAGDIFRTDGVVALPLSALRPGQLPSAAEVLTRIDGAVAAGGAP
jgi:formylmethanofuran dehydrogenase subunit B